MFWLTAFFPALISLVVPANARGDIYKWTDEQGGTYYSDLPPPASGEAKNVEVVVKETKPTAREQALLARIENLERLQQARQYAAPAPYDNYTTPAPPPPPVPNYYDAGYVSGTYSGYYPGYYPNYYYPVVPAYSYVVYPRRTVISRPLYAAPRGGSIHGSTSFRAGTPSHVGGSHGGVPFRAGGAVHGGGSMHGGGGHGGRR